MMKCERLEMSAVKEIYETYLIYDFPQDEVKPLGRIEAMAEEDKYFAYGLFAEDRLVGYAFFVGNENDKVVLLDYFAIVKKFRRNGYGTEFLNALKNTLTDSMIILEAEDDVYAHNADDKKVREKRLEFYENAGAKDTGIRTLVFGVHYIIFVCDEIAKKEEVGKAVREIYEYMFEPHFSDKYNIK
ncbi:MAG: GNAT family N-acetyltransferase [Lachnospiraceae bacterium]|nr:GNAT family N-acetyltransferase [Lachnospira sp.]MBR6697767.1 GNAT family N-acetyltransferase [Lachnospiraceae bacterium]